MEKLKVLIADDIEVIAEFHKNAVLKKQTMEVIGIANNGQDEYDKIIELQPDIVITDNQMPGMNGTEVIKKIFDSNIENKPKFVLVTGDRNFSLFVEYSKMNVSILYKPASEEKLLDLLDKIEVNIKEQSNPLQ